MPTTESMTSSPGPAYAHDPPASDIYYPDDVFPQNSPLMKPCIPKLEPSPSPPAIPHLVSLAPGSGRKSSNRRHKVDPSRGDAVLIQHLDGGRCPEISQEAAFRPLDHFTSEDDCQSCASEETMGDESEDEDTHRINDVSSIPISQFTKNAIEPSVLGSASGTGHVFLRSLAKDALAATQAKGTILADEILSLARDTQGSRRASLAENSAIPGGGEIVMSNAKRPVLAPPVSPYPIHRSPGMYSPQQHASNQVLMPPNNIRSPTGLAPGSHGELAPLQATSARSELSSHDKLPSISQLYEQLHTSPKDISAHVSPKYPHSPPIGRLGTIPGNHTSPPISPNERYRHSIPSPAKTLPAISPFSQIGTSSNHQSPSGLDHDVSGTKPERLPINQILTPPTDGISNRMSIDSVTNPTVVGQYICDFKGCNAQPFQTQYLLNSHANVHSTARPHYCSVKGCPRSEGGQGFKRKNEMIRHGLVHDSPGYVCPFCPDREHKYPRPDNLQRHVRVHHVDKDREDPALREVLAHRPDGPNRGRRRRGGP
ncbi:hypothetical protein GGS21DRAFT_540116 [Xylaria nigripes]|nr:hypothetical protein GGS21DRAFT_540116 [Xylaria nigripes]